MGKNKGQKSKTQKEKAFTIIHTKKSKTKAVTKNLKKINFQTKAKTDKADEKFKAIQGAVFESTQPKQEKSKKIKTNPQPKTAQDTVVDMETATESFAKL